VIGQAVQAVPADVRNRNARREPGDPPGQQAEAVNRRPLLAGLEEELEPHADAEEEGAPVESLAKRRLQRAAQRLAGRREGADAGEQQAAFL
jgi:hypothetical protein